MIAIGIPALKKISLSFPIAGICIVLGSVFQAVGDGYLSMISSIVRQIVILIPCAYILGKIGGLDSVWYAFVFAEFFALLIHVFFYRNEDKKKLQF